MAVKGVDEPPLQQVQDLHCTVTRTTDQIVSGWMEGKAVDPCTMNYKTKLNA